MKLNGMYRVAAIQLVLYISSKNGHNFNSVNAQEITTNSTDLNIPVTVQPQTRSKIKGPKKQKKTSGIPDVLPFDPRAKVFSRFSSIFDMAKVTMNTKYSNKELSSRLQNYACHCFPTDNSGEIIGGKGAVINDIDRLCKQLYDCHTCIHDAECSALSKKDPEFDGYKYNIDPVSGQISCDNQTPTPKEPSKMQCKKAMCECDRDFSKKLGAQWNDDNFDSKVWWNTKNIQKHKKIGDPLKEYEDVCKKKSFLPNSHECCGRSLINPVINDCCAGTPVSVGSC